MMVALAPFSTTTSERMKTELGLSHRRANTRLDRPLGRGAGGDADHRAIAHQRGVERHRRIVSREDLADMGGHQRIAFAKRIGHRTDR